ncbi:ABC transporter ATP-binding protein [Halapricum hydrolyticum]|uniref:ABC transporter ATP-binding protein n=1 Tax=Halapricum hydrolyticum TaxID=2979991 RepID=A0AAE3LEJ0_9EURY|nr:ABC transporter ATP-binding protein [Halapricum hydrolyticum]MCU4718435.1 ABC transporter ATP-binding protein [Halapricum hydrolyticum]MCU4726452.1 ABC transporter ATP-binding protein [Halapricum hydrolyticum]
MAAIEISGVSKRFGDVTALQNLDLTVEEGEVFGFLGPNGAGKSTTIDILLDHVRPTVGSAQVFGHDTQAASVPVRERTGVLPEGYGALGRMTGRTHLEFALQAKRAEGDPQAILDRVGIAEAGDRRVEDYSKGMKQRLMLGMALAGDPDLLILDEPTTGLDPNGARRMRQIVQAEADRGTTVFFSSHILEQVEAVCDRVGILNQGELVAVDTIDGLREAAGATGQLHVTMSSIPDGLVETIEQRGGVTSVAVEGTTLAVGCENAAKGAIVADCYEAGTVENVETSETSLEDLFVSYTGGEN